AVVVAAVEHREVERLGRLRLPQPKRVRRVVPVPEDRHVVRDAVHDRVRDPAHTQASEIVHVTLRPAAELHGRGPLRTRDLPWITEREPLVRALDLPAVDDLLLEDAELVADAVRERRDLERRERGDEARGKTSEAAAAEPGLGLLGEQAVEIEA